METVHPAERSLAELFAVLVKGRVILLRSAALAGAVTLAFVLTQPRTYSSSFSVFPRMSGASAAGLSSLAAQFGLSVPGVDLTQSPGFYAEMATSPEVLRPLIDSTLDASGKKVVLDDILNVHAENPDERTAALIDALGRAIRASVAPKTGMVRIRVVTSDASASTAIAGRLLTQLQTTTIRMRQTQAGADESFGSERLAAAKAQLTAAERRLASYAVSNRFYAQDPAAMVEFGRLQREVQLQQGVVQALSQSVEQSRMEEQRDTPVLGIVEAVRRPLIADRRYAAVKAVAGALAAVLLTAAILLLGGGGQPPVPASTAWSIVRAELAGDLRRPWRLLLAIAGAGRGPLSPAGDVPA